MAVCSEIQTQIHCVDRT